MTTNDDPLPLGNDTTEKSNDAAPSGNAAKKPAKRAAPPRTIANQIYAARLLLSGTEADRHIMLAMERYGYTSAKRDEGKALIDAADSSIDAQQQKRAAQVEATTTNKEAEKLLRRASSDLAAVARAIFKGNRAALAALGLTGGAEPKELSEYLLYATRLYDGALNSPHEVQEMLAQFGYPTSRLTEEKLLIDALQHTGIQKAHARGESQSATPDRAAAFKTMNDWCAQYRKIARIALREHPQKLEALGIRVRS